MRIYSKFMFKIVCFVKTLLKKKSIILFLHIKAEIIVLISIILQNESNTSYDFLIEAALNRYFYLCYETFSRTAREDWEFLKKKIIKCLAVV